MANYGFDPKTKIYGNISEINTDIHEKKKRNHRYWKRMLVGLLRNPMQTNRGRWHITETEHSASDVHCNRVII